MKEKISLFLLFLLCTINAQETRAIYPFKYQDKWGIVDSLGNEVVAPKYANLNVSKDFTFAEFDKKEVYNLKTGKKTSAFGEMDSEIQILGNTYFLFNSSKKSILIDLENQDTIRLKSRYRYLGNKTLHNESKTDSTQIVLGILKNDKVLILTADKDLNLAIKQKVSNNSFDFIKVNGTENTIGLITLKDGKLTYYDYQLKVLKQEPFQGYMYEVSKEKITAVFNIPNLGDVCFSCESPWFNEWQMRAFRPGEKHHEYYVFVDEIKKENDANFSIPVNLELFNYYTEIKGVKIPSLNAYFFHDSRFQKGKQIMFPTQYLKQ